MNKNLKNAAKGLLGILSAFLLVSVMAACALFCWTAAAKDVTWAGATGANWDTSSQNWVLTGTTTPATLGSTSLS